MSYRLKDGSEVFDPRLGRLIEFDERSRSYLARDLPAVRKATAPRSYSWACKVVLDQGNVGSCVGNAVSHEAAASPVIVPGITETVALQVYHRAQQLDSIPGTNYEGTSVLAGMKAGTERGWYKQYRWALGLNDVVMTIGYHGPVVLGINWYDDMFDPDSKGYIRIGGNVAGGHAILCNGVDVKNKRVKVHNSWGTGWGGGHTGLTAGEAFVSYADLDRLLRESGEAAVPVTRTQPKAPVAKPRARARAASKK